MDYDYVMQNHTIKFISQEKDLGVIFNSRLLLDAHINNKVSKVNKIMELIRKPSTILNEVKLAQQHEAFVGPHLELSNCVWIQSSKNILR